MTPWFSSPPRIAALESAAASWIGTPYVQSGAVRGCGASGHRLASAVLMEAGFPVPTVPERGGTRLREYTLAMRRWLDGAQTHFAAISLDDLAPGDVLLCEIGIGHIGLFLGGHGARALQVLRTAPTHIVSINDPQVRAHLVAAYRPIEPTS